MQNRRTQSRRVEPPYTELRAELRAEPPYAELRAELCAKPRAEPPQTFVKSLRRVNFTSTGHIYSVVR